MRTTPTFRYPGTVPTPKAPDWTFVTLIGVVTITVLLGLLYVVCKSAGWL